MEEERRTQKIRKCVHDSIFRSLGGASGISFPAIGLCAYNGVPVCSCRRLYMRRGILTATGRCLHYPNVMPSISLDR